MTGQTIAHYTVAEKLGEGAGAIVYRAQDLKLGREVVLKFFSTEGPESFARFQHEARTVSSLNHPNICTIYEIGEHDGQYFLAMEMLEGEVLAKTLAGRGLSIERVIDFGSQIADALQAAHAERIVHRDLKPANIFVTRSGRIKLLDFGIAILLPRRPAPSPPGPKTSSKGGTIPYMSPEQAQADDLDHRSDLFSLGIILYEMATGRRPFAAATGIDTLSAIISSTPLPPRTIDPRLPPELERIIVKSLEKRAALRYQSASDLKADLQRLKRDLDVAGSANATSQGRASNRSSLWWRLTAAATAAVLITGAGWLAVRAVRLRSPSGLSGSPVSSDAVAPASVTNTPTPAIVAGPPPAPTPAVVAVPPPAPVPDSAKSPTAPPTGNQLAIARRQIDLKLYDQAIDTLRKVADGDNGHQALDAAFLIASVHETRGDAANAMSTYVEIATRFPDDPRAPEALTRLARSLLTSRRPQSQASALSTLNAVAEKYPRSAWAPRALLLRGELEARQGTYQRDETLGGSLPTAAATYREIVERYPSSESAPVALDRLGRIYADEKRFAIAAATFEKLAARDAGGQYDAWFAAAEIYDRRLKDHARAKAAYSRVPASSPHYSEALKRQR